jgi:hypothetical protein
VLQLPPAHEIVHDAFALHAVSQLPVVQERVHVLPVAQSAVHGPAVTGHASVHFVPVGHEHVEPLHPDEFPTGASVAESTPDASTPEDEEEPPPLDEPCAPASPAPTFQSYVHATTTKPSAPTLATIAAVRDRTPPTSRSYRTGTVRFTFA